MVKDTLNYMQHATWYAEVGLMIFVAVFVVVTIRALVTPKGEVRRRSELPLAD